MPESTGNPIAEAPEREDDEKAVNSVKEIGDVPEQPLDRLVAEGDDASDPRGERDGSELQRRAEHGISDCACCCTIDGEDQHDEEHVG